MNKINLTTKKCTPCQGGIPPMSSDLAGKYLNKVPSWELIDNASKLKRTFKFDNFEDAMRLAQRVGELCETEGHHPDITIGWGYCRVEFQTHKISGQHENDFIMAANVSQLAEQNSKNKSKPNEGFRATH